MGQFLLRQLEVLLTHEVTDKGLIGDKELFAVGTVLHFAVIDVLVVLVPPQ